MLNIIKEHPYSYKLFLEDIIAYLNPANNPTHEQIKVIFLVTDWILPYRVLCIYWLKEDDML